MVRVLILVGGRLAPAPSSAVLLHLAVHRDRPLRSALTPRALRLMHVPGITDTDNGTSSFLRSPGTAADHQRSIAAAQ